QIREGGERADCQQVPASLNLPQHVEPPEIQEPALAERPEIEGDVEVGTSGHRREWSFVAQHLQRVAERSGFEQASIRHRRLHVTLSESIGKSPDTPCTGTGCPRGRPESRRAMAGG